jgi:hypothetical protein
VAYRTRMPNICGTEYPRQITANDTSGNSQAINSNVGNRSIRFI